MGNGTGGGDLHEERAALVQRIFDEALNHGEYAVVDEAFSPQFADRSAPEQPQGPAGVRAYFRDLRTAFPDLHVTITSLAVEGDMVLLREQWRGTHRSIYEGVAPTGQAFEREMTRRFRFSGGQIVEESSEGPDLAGLL